MSCGCLVAAPYTLWEDEVGFSMEPVFSYIGSVSDVVRSNPGKWYSVDWWSNVLTSGPKEKVSLASAGAMTSNAVLTYTLA
jgi:hypothetical protein